MNVPRLRALAALTALALTTLPLAVVSAQTPSVIKIGVTPGPHEEIIDEVARLAAKKGLTVQVVPISDYAVPNQALDAGDLQANSFQNPPFLAKQIADRGYKLSVVGKTIFLPMGLYSRKLKSLKDLRDGAIVAIPNDPSNGARGLFLLQSAKLITLKRGAGRLAGVSDIAENPHHLVIRELNAAQTPRSLDDLDAACINGNYAATAGLSPQRDAIFAEGGGVGEAQKSVYANVIVVRTVDKDQPWVNQLVALYHSTEIRRFIVRRFGSSIYPAF